MYTLEKFRKERIEEDSIILSKSNTLVILILFTLANERKEMLNALLTSVVVKRPRITTEIEVLYISHCSIVLISIALICARSITAFAIDLHMIRLLREYVSV